MLSSPVPKALAIAPQETQVPNPFPTLFANSGQCDPGQHWASTEAVFESPSPDPIQRDGTLELTEMPPMMGAPESDGTAPALNALNVGFGQGSRLLPSLQPQALFDTSIGPRSPLGDLIPCDLQPEIRAIPKGKPAGSPFNAKDNECVFLEFTRPMDFVTSSKEGNCAERKTAEKDARYAHHQYFINHMNVQRGRQLKCTHRLTSW